MKKTLFFCTIYLMATSIFSQEKKLDNLFTQTSEMNNLMVNYQADYDILNRFYSTKLNANSNDNFNSPQRRKRILSLIQDYLLKLPSNQFQQMSKNGQVDYLLFKRNLNKEKNKLEQENQTFQKISSYLPETSEIYLLEEQRKRGAKPQPEKDARLINQLIKNVQEKTSSAAANFNNLHNNELQFIQAEINSRRGALKNYSQFYKGYDPNFDWWILTSANDLDSHLNLFNIIVSQTIYKKNKNDANKTDIKAEPIGRTALETLLQEEFINYTPEELIQIAQQELRWCTTEIIKASREMGYDSNWKKALEAVKNTFVLPGNQPQKVMEIYNESIQFLKDNHLVTIPAIAEEAWRMNMMPPAQQRYAPFFLGGEVLLISYPTDDMNFDDKMMSLRSNNPHFSKAVVHHELIPGHHLQGFMNDRYKTYRNFRTPFWHEGNALYWEFLLYEKGFAKSPQDKIGMLFWRMHRCARIIFSLNFHLGNWTPQVCIDFLVDKVGHENFSAEAEVRRSFVGGYGPLYQIAYMIGGLQFWKLKQEIVDQKLMTIQQYNDNILHENAMPIEFIRAILLNKPLTENYSSNWKFYNFEQSNK